MFHPIVNCGGKCLFTYTLTSISLNHDQTAVLVFAILKDQYWTILSKKRKKEKRSELLINKAITV